MPGIYKGGTPVTSLSKGATSIASVYVGGTKVFPGVFSPLSLFGPGDDGFLWQSFNKEWAVNADGTGGLPTEGGPVAHIVNEFTGGTMADMRAGANYGAFGVATDKPYISVTNTGTSNKWLPGAGTMDCTAGWTFVHLGQLTGGNTGSNLGFGPNRPSPDTGALNVAYINSFNHRTVYSNILANNEVPYAPSGDLVYSVIGLARDSNAAKVLKRYAQGVRLADFANASIADQIAGGVPMLGGMNPSYRVQAIFAIDRVLTDEEVENLSTFWLDYYNA